MDKQRLAAFRKQLEEKRDSLNSLVAKTENESRVLSENERGDSTEEATLASNRSFLYSQSDTGWEQLQLVNEALERMEEGEYGICESCGRPIGLKRLKAVPWTRYCRDCQEEDERRSPSER